MTSVIENAKVPEDSISFSVLLGHEPVKSDPVPRVLPGISMRNPLARSVDSTSDIEHRKGYKKYVGISRSISLLLYVP